MKCLIATQNKDKSNIISQMLLSILGNNLQIKDLTNYGNYIEGEEKGNNIERAKQKAQNAINQIQDPYDFILGIDDGIIIDNVEYAAVKEHLFDIIVGDKVKVGSKIYITRAYYLITKDKKEFWCYNKIPYIVQRKLSSYDKSGYQLNTVISTVDNNKVLTERSSVELNEYFLKYTLDDLKTLFSKVNKD